MRPLTLSALALLVLVFPSCELFKPKNQTQAYDPYGQQPAASPYGQVPQSNPYGTPEANPYGQQAAPANPYAAQAPANPYGGYEQAQTSPAGAQTPNNTQAPAPSTYSGGGGGGGGGSVTVQSGDNLTKIARRNNTTVSALKSANGLTTDFIRAGQTLRLP